MKHLRSSSLRTFKPGYPDSCFIAIFYNVWRIAIKFIINWLPNAEISSMKSSLWILQFYLAFSCVAPSHLTFAANDINQQSFPNKLSVETKFPKFTLLISLIKWKEIAWIYYIFLCDIFQTAYCQPKPKHDHLHLLSISIDPKYIYILHLWPEKHN